MSLEKDEFIKEFTVEFMDQMELMGECAGIDYNEDILQFAMADPASKNVIKLLAEEEPEDASLLLDSIIKKHTVEAAVKYAEFAWCIFSNKAD